MTITEKQVKEEMAEIKKKWSKLTPSKKREAKKMLEACQKFIDLTEQLTQRDGTLAGLERKETEQKNLLESQRKKEAEQKKVLVKQAKRLADLKKQQGLIDAGKAYLLGLKREIRSLSFQCGETETEEEDEFLSKQLSVCGPAEVPYLQQLIARLKTQRQKIFRLGGIEQDDDLNDPEGTKKKEYEVGRKIGRGRVIPVH